MTLSATMLVALAACTDSAGVSQPPPPVRAASLNAEASEPPAGRRWQGINDVVVAVPEHWGTETSPCAAPDGDVVSFVGSRAARTRCGAVPTTGVSSVVIARGDLLGSAARLAKSATRNGVAIRHNGIHCDALAVCSTIFVVPEADAAFQITYRGPSARASVELVRDSITRLPRGYVTVPLIDFVASVASEKRLLARSGLVGRFSQVDPLFATGTEPAAGMAVERGTAVRLTVR